MVALGLALVLLAQSSAEPQALARWLEGQERFPSLTETQAAAERALLLTPAEVLSGWAERSRLRGLVPRLDVRFGTDQDFDIRQPSVGREAWSEAQGFGVDIGLRFGLSDLVFSMSELRASRVQRRQAELINKVRREIAILYVRRLKAELRQDAWGQIELDSLLDGLTQGFWRSRMENSNSGEDEE